MARTSKTAAIIALATSLGACSRDADVAQQNLSIDADNFRIPRRVVALNGITDKYLFEVTGYCAIKASTETKNLLNVICKVGEGYKKNSVYMSDNVSLFVEQLDPTKVSTSFYTVVFKPATIIPAIEVR